MELNAGSRAVAAATAMMLSPVRLEELAKQWLAEDLPSFDYGGAVVGDGMARAHLKAKSLGLLAGVPFVEAIFRVLQCSVVWLDGIHEGCVLPATIPVVIAEVSGPSRNLLLGERVALNLLSRCSGVATRAASLVAVAQGQLPGWQGRVAGTRKTTPGFRLVEKYATAVGGADTHRMDLSSMVMLKDNHIAACGGHVSEAVACARRLAGFTVRVEVECASLEEAERAIAAGADIVMLDNFSPDEFKRVAAILRRKAPQITIEGSGGININTLPSYICADADVLSLSIAQGAPALDFSLKIVP